jgi:hypothetical protein
MTSVFLQLESTIELIILVFMGLSVLLCQNVIVTNDLLVLLLLTLVEKNLIFNACTPC